MASSLQIFGTLQLDGPHGPLQLKGKGSVVELSVSSLWKLPGLIRGAQQLRHDLALPLARLTGMEIRLLFWRITLARIRP